jgi:non-ribosomal peptide synthetase component F
VCCPSAAQKSLPAQWINDSKLTIWFSVPSTGALMNKLRMLTPNKYPKLRYSLFCGEALPIEITEKWQKAAPNSVLENLYGPTELTIACTLYRWDSARSPAECEMGVVPIGDPYPAMEVLVADESLNEVPPGETGELLMTGPQLSLGYWKDPEKTAAAFVTPPEKSTIYYRTGDRVRRPLPGKPMTYLGRVDFQIKIQGYRVELGEIEAIAREAAGVDVAIAVGWPLSASGADGVVVFLGADKADIDAVTAVMKERLPAYMVPSQIRTIPAFPLNSNGKVDRKALTKMLEEAK